jgi:DNA-binding MarR family transcriptional regulator
MLEMALMTKSAGAIQRRERSERLADIFTVMQRGFVLNLSRELSKGQVTFPQYLLLSFLQQGPLAMNEIARRMGHTTAATTGLIDRLETTGLARRTRDREDRRVFRVTITDEGSALVRRVRADMVEGIEKLMAALEPDEQEAWAAIYDKIFAVCYADISRDSSG